MKQYVFFVQMQSYALAAQFFEGYVWYFSSLHPAFEMSWDIEYYKNSFCFLSKTETFQNDVGYVTKLSV